MNKQLKIKKSNWLRIVNYINSKDIGFIFKRKETIKNLPGIPISTIDGYTIRLRTIGVLEKAGRAQHKLVNKIPENMTTTTLMKLLVEQHQYPWRAWFIQLEDRVKKIRGL